MHSKWESGAHRIQSRLWDISYKHKHPFARQWEDEGHQEVDHGVWWWGQVMIEWSLVSYGR